MNYKKIFIDLIENSLNSKLSRKEISEFIWNNISIDEINDNDLLANCEWALRHIDKNNYKTSIPELKYYLDCLKDKKDFNVQERDIYV